jgi:uncharacterized protein (TIGR02145 family)
MKSSSSDTPPWNGTNSSGFSALPGGLRYSDNGNFSNVGGSGNWWSSSAFGPNGAWVRYLYSDYGYVFRGSSGQRLGFSVRCVRDE